jgi:5-carboxymethyl-2-hydroxymuconic-semialdehyde dehydrogenase
MTSQLASPLDTLRAPGTVRHFIGGEWAESADGGTFETINPATNAPIARVAKGGEAELGRAIAAARKAFDEGPWPRMRPAERARMLRKVGDLITQRAPEIAQTETLDTGLPIAQTGGAQIPRAADNFYFFAEMANHMDGRAFHNADYLNYTIQKPVGVAGLITPWNLPFMLTSWKVAPCLASGCTAVVKPASWTPLSNEKLAECIRDAGVPEGVFNLVYGSGETVGMGMVRSEAIQAISFTGETTTGKAIMREGAATMKRYSMELGGKSPIVVFADADYERALDAAVFGVYSLNGERCTASSRCLVERSIYDRFVADLIARVNKIRVGDPMDRATEIGSLIHPSHLDRVLEYVEIGKAEGAKLVAGGGRMPGFDRGNYMQPTLFADVDNRMQIAQEEVFGPFLVVMPFDTEEEAIRLASDVKYGLAGYLWTGNTARAHRVAQGIQCGMVWVNSQNVRDLRTPFGGAKESGIGREGGDYSWEFYCEMKNVAIALGEQHIPHFGR